MRRFLPVLVLLPAAAFGQLQLFEFDGTTETAVTSLYQMPPAAPGDKAVTRFRLFNNGAAAATFQNLAIAGQAFQISAAPSLPYVIAPGSFAEFKTLFTPDAIGGYSANLLVNTIAVTLRCEVVAQPILSAGTTPLPNGATFNFGKVQFGKSISQQFTVSNPNGTAVTVSQIAVHGAGFQGPSGIQTPLTLSPSQSATFQVTFAPATGQTYTGTLLIDQRSFNLTGLGLDPPLPPASIHFAAPTVTSALQTNLSIELASASQVAGTGTLSMEFQPSVAGVKDDPAILFLSGPPRVATVTISPGDSIAKFGTAASIRFQTGSTAGTIVFTLQLGSSTQQASLTIAPAPVSFDSASGTLEPGSVIVGLIGYDNTYSTSQIQFTFYDTKGKTLPPGLMTVDVAKSFQSYFATTPAGGSFQLRAQFPLSGDSVTLGSVEVSIANSMGKTTTQRLKF